MYCTEDLDRATLMDLEGNLVEREQMIERSDWLGSWVLTSYQRDKTCRDKKASKSSGECAKTVYELPNLIKGPAWQSIKMVFHEHNTAWQDTSWLSRGSKHSQLERGIETLQPNRQKRWRESIDRHEASWSIMKHCNKEMKPRICNKELKTPFFSAKAPCREDWPRALFHLLKYIIS